MTSDTPSPPPITSKAEFGAAVLWALQASAAANARRIVWVDGDFSDWPLDEPALHETLTAWLRRPGRRLVLLATDFGGVPRHHPRFVAWRRLWSHAVEAWTPADGAAVELPTLSIDDGDIGVHVIDVQRWRGRAVVDPRAVRLWRDQIDAVLQRCESAFPVNTLGLWGMPLSGLYSCAGPRKGTARLVCSM